jgi:O-succinylbenzoic acid--CoA ligase
VNTQFPTSNQQFLHFIPEDYIPEKLAELLANTKDTYFLEVLQFMESWINGKINFTFRTSGSTGKPKEITHSRAMMELSARNTLEALKVKPDDVALACMDVKFIGGAMMLVRAIVNQMPLIVIPPSKNPLDLPIPNFEFAAMVPLQLQTIKETNDLTQLHKLQKCKVLILGGSQVSQIMVPWIKNQKCQIFETYGMTETVSHVALKPLNGKFENKHFTGVGNIRFAKNENGKLKLNGDITEGKWLLTNDIVDIISDRKFEWQGRADFTINSGGIKIQPEELEKELAQPLKQHKIENFVIAGIPDAEYGEQVTLVIESSLPINTEELKIELKKQVTKISNKKFPKSIVVLAKLPRTATDKIDRKAIIKLITDRT